ncbi:unnamed protein product [Heterotrigona itama]|uniref:Uncharacterized protein n=1 Tax=Heterotrigona itama TaxID=395501 RepID=A0A6V7GUU0_9HYME|nr:unnamed protein product [Heterotrigona itama]
MNRIEIQADKDPKTLGLLWSPTTDTSEFKITPTTSKRILTIPRRILINSSNSVGTSERIYGACIYLRCQEDTAKWARRLLSTKSPLKTILLLRLEHCGASITNLDTWRHISSEHNPADLISRGVEPKRLIDTYLWWSGPVWLNKPENM